MDQVYFCPVCGEVTYDSILEGSELKKKCLYCGSTIFGTGKDYDSFWQNSNDLDEIDELIERIPETVREEYVYNNPLFNKEKYEYRERQDQEWAERNRRGEDIYGTANLPKCPTCGSTNLTRLSGVGMITMFGGFGVTDGNAGKTFKCNNCGYRW